MGPHGLARYKASSIQHGDQCPYKTYKTTEVHKSSTTKKYMGLQPLQNHPCGGCGGNRASDTITKGTAGSLPGTTGAPSPSYAVAATSFPTIVQPLATSLGLARRSPPQPDPPTPLDLWQAMCPPTAIHCSMSNILARATSRTRKQPSNYISDTSQYQVSMTPSKITSALSNNRATMSTREGGDSLSISSHCLQWPT